MSLSRRALFRLAPAAPLALIPGATAAPTPAQVVRPPLVFVPDGLSSEQVARVREAVVDAFRSGRPLILGSGVRIER